MHTFTILHDGFRKLSSKLCTSFSLCSHIDIQLVCWFLYLLFPTFTVLLAPYDMYEKITYVFEVTACFYLGQYHRLHLRDGVPKDCSLTDLFRTYVICMVMIFVKIV